MKNRKSASSTAQLISCVFYIFLQTHKDFFPEDYRRYVFKNLEGRYLRFRILGILYTFKLGVFVGLLWRLVFPNFVTHVGQRKKIIYDFVLEEIREGTPQLVVLGGGFDFLASYLAKDNAYLKVFEVDHPLTQDTKKTILSKSINFKFVSCDFSKTSFIERMKTEGWSGQQPTIFIWEGVTMYLSESDVLNSLIKIKEASSSAKIIFSFMNKRENGSIQFYQAPVWTDFVLKRVREPFTWGCERGEIAKVLETQNWKLLQIWTEEECKLLIHESETLAAAELNCE